MKKTYIKLFSALLAVVSFTSCGDFLDEVSQDEFKPETVEDYQEILNGEGYGMFVSVDPLSHVFTDDVQGADMSAQSWNIIIIQMIIWLSRMSIPGSRIWTNCLPIVS